MCTRNNGYTLLSSNCTTHGIDCAWADIGFSAANVMADSIWVPTQPEGNVINVLAHIFEGDSCRDTIGVGLEGLDHQPKTMVLVWISVFATLSHDRDDVF